MESRGLIHENQVFVQSIALHQTLNAQEQEPQTVSQILLSFLEGILPDKSIRAKIKEKCLQVHTSSVL